MGVQAQAKSSHEAEGARRVIEPVRLEDDVGDGAGGLEAVSER